MTTQIEKLRTSGSAGANGSRYHVQLPNLPSKWKYERFEKILDVQGGSQPPKSKFRYEPAPGYVQLLQIRDFGEHTVPTFVREDSVNKRCNEDDVLIARYGASLGRILTGRAGAYNVALAKVIFNKDQFLNRYLLYLLQTPFFQTPIHMISRSAQNGFNKGDLSDILIPVAPLPEQHRIVAEIERQFTRLEVGVAALRRVQVNLKRHRSAILKAACEGKLVENEVRKAKREGRTVEIGEELLKRILAERRKIHESGQAAAIRKRKYKEPTKPVIPEDEELPNGWTWASWDQVGISQNGRPFQSAEYQPNGIKLLRPGNLHVSGKVVWNEDNTRRLPPNRAGENLDLIVRGPELVMNLTAQSLKDEFLGRICLTSEDEECLLNQRLARLTPIILSPKFVLYLLKAWRFRRFVDGLNSGSLIQHMFTSQLADFTFPLPPLAEQTRIVADVERRLSVVEELEAMVSANLQRATRLRQSILQKAFTGELT